MLRGPVMSTYLAGAGPVDSRLVHKPEARPKITAEFAAGYRATAQPEGSPARGILIALLISVPFWGLIGFTIYLLS